MEFRTAVEAQNAASVSRLRGAHATFHEGVNSNRFLEPKRSSSLDTRSDSRFACPFMKANPRKMQGNDICARTTWPTIPRLKYIFLEPQTSRKMTAYWTIQGTFVPASLSTEDLVLTVLRIVRERKRSQCSPPVGKTMQAFGSERAYHAVHHSVSDVQTQETKRIVRRNRGKQMVRDMVHHISGQKETSITVYVPIPLMNSFSLSGYRIKAQYTCSTPAVDTSKQSSHGRSSWMVAGNLRLPQAAIVYILFIWVVFAHRYQKRC